MTFPIQIPVRKFAFKALWWLYQKMHFLNHQIGKWLDKGSYARMLDKLGDPEDVK